MWRTEVMKRADKVGEKADLWSTSMSAVKKGDIKLFHEYLVNLFTR